MNNNLSISLTGLKNLTASFELTGNMFDKAVAYKVEDNTMVLYWHEHGTNIQRLPYPMNPRQLADFVWGWLEYTKPTMKEPLTDGSTEVGWRLTSSIRKAWNDQEYSYATITPIWFVYGK